MTDPDAPNRPALDVYLREQRVGRLWLDEGRRFVFQYDAAWIGRSGAVPLSLRLPLQAAPYPDDRSRPFFANLLPEAELKRLVAQRLQLSEGNDFALLGRIGGECAGAVSVLPAGHAPAARPGYRELDGAELDEILAELPRRPLLAGREGIRLSLAGAQHKLPVYLEGDRLSLVTGDAPSSHILKPPIRDLADTVPNEAFCMTLAQALGLPVPAVTIRQGRERLFVVARYDRSRDPQGRLVRLHQEDFCQALGFLPDQKYESEGGPSLVQCFALLQTASHRPAADRMALLRWTIFNVLIGNADAHAKNLAILFTDRGPRLAPFYDLLCTQVYPDLASRYAMAIGGENRPGYLQRRHWERLSAEVGIKAGLVFKTLEGMAAAVVPAAERLAPTFAEAHGGSPIVERILGVIARRARGV